MLECAGEQSRPGEGSNLVNSTESSIRAQNTLKDKLQAASGEQVVVIAHSQGCLLLHSVLQELQNDNAELLQRLRVFTFGNPSHDWDFELYHAEHFHNEKDFVAKLGVGRKEAAEAYGGTIFANSSWKGQLFNAQYSFNPKHYGIARGASKLLVCTDGSNPQTMAVRKRKPKPPPKAKAEPEYGSESESGEEPEPEPEKNPKPKPKPRASPQATLPEGRNKRVHLKQALP